MNLSDIAILNIKGSDYHCIISRISKSQAIKLLQNIDLTEKKEHYKTKHQEQFWSCKCTSNSKLNKKVENDELKKNIKFFDSI